MEGLSHSHYATCTEAKIKIRHATNAKRTPSETEEEEEKEEKQLTWKLAMGFFPHRTPCFVEKEREGGVGWEKGWKKMRLDGILSGEMRHASKY